MSTTEAPRVRAIAAPTSAKRSGIPFLDAASGGGLDADERSAVFGRGDELGRSAARLVRDVSVWRGSRPCARRCRGSREGARHERLGVLGDVRVRIGSDRIGQHRAAAARHEPDTPARARQRQQQIAANVGLEVDREIVALRRHARARCTSARHVSPRSLARHPRHVECFNVHARDQSARATGSSCPPRDRLRRLARSPGPSQSHRAPSRDRRRARVAAAVFGAAVTVDAADVRGHPRRFAAREASIRQPDEHAFLPIRESEDGRTLPNLGPVDHDAKCTRIGSAEDRPRNPRRALNPHLHAILPLRQARCGRGGNRKNVVAKFVRRARRCSALRPRGTPSLAPAPRPRGRPPLNLSATSRLCGGTLMSRYEVSWLHRNVRSPPPSRSFG